MDGEDADPEAPGLGGPAGKEDLTGVAWGTRAAAGSFSGAAAGAGPDAVGQEPSRVAAGSASGVAAGARSSSSVAVGASSSSGRTAGAAASSDERQQGMDPNSTYTLEITLLGNPKKARKNVGYFGFEKDIDSDTTNYMDFVESVVVKYPPRYLEVAHVHYYDEILKSYPEVKSDQELLSMFEKHSKTKMVQMFIAYWHPSEPYDPEEWQNDVHRQANSNTEQDEENKGQDEDSYLCNPLPENEHVGVDEEIMYLEEAPVQVVLYHDKEKDKDYVPDHDNEDASEVEAEFGAEEEADEELVGHEAEHIRNFEYDQDDPPMEVGSIYPSMAEFRVAISQHAIKHEFEFNIEKSAPYRFRAYCSRRDKDNCPWRLHASTADDLTTVVVRKNPCAHDCSSTRRKKRVKNATKHWICAKVKDWLIDDATLGAKDLQKKLKEHHKVSINYKRVYMGKELALKQLYGDWDNSFDNLYRFKAQVESVCPGSIVVIDHHKINEKIRFRRFFFALKPCIEGFLNGCRPYLAIDSTFLTGKFKGQLASASTIDGHNWLFPVCFGVFDSDTNDNWEWFMQRLREAIGSPKGLTICTDCGQPVMHGVEQVFPEAEHRECMFHLVSNFKKKFNGKVFDDHLWASAYSWNPYLFEKHWAAMESAKPAATDYLRKSHTRLWTRSQFSTICKVDYVTNNLAECFNNWIKHHKSLNLDDFMDKLRQLLMIKWNQRRGPPKKRAKKAKRAGSSIVPCNDEAPATSMSFPPRQSVETTTNKQDNHVSLGSTSIKSQSLVTTSKKRRKIVNSNSGASKR